MDYENDHDKLKVLRDKLFKLRSEMTRHLKKKNMMKGFLDKKDNFFSQEIEVVRHNLDTNIDTKIDQLNERVNKDIINNSKIIENDASNTEYLENEFVTEHKLDDKINETERSQASEDSQISKINKNKDNNTTFNTTLQTKSDFNTDSSI